MKYRKRMSSKGSKRYFTKTAKRVHPMNGRVRPMRGGYRL